MQRGGKYGWEAMVNPDLKISDLDENAILGAVREGIRNGRLPESDYSGRNTYDSQEVWFAS